MSKIHSVKVPRLYKVASSVLKSFQEGQGSVKTLVFQARKKHPNVKALFALVNECLKHEQDLLLALESLKILQLEQPLDKNLALILVTELIFGKKSLPGESKPIQTVLKYQAKLQEFLSQNSNSSVQNVVQPRYVRVNLLKTSLDSILVDFKRDGFELVKTPSNYKDFIDKVVTLKENEFMLDFHMQDFLLVFPHKTQFYDHPLYLDGSLVLQDKASCLSVFALNPDPGSVLFDACAAPGMKTCQAQAHVGTQGQVIAVERNGKRFKILNEITGKYCKAKPVKTIQADFLQLNPEDYSQVEFIVADPTCSGSGTYFFHYS